MSVVAGGRAAVTEYEVVEPRRYVALVRCRLRTGRTHQIRVHMKHIGHPIVGDPLYSGPQWRGIPDKRVQKAIASLERQALHATRITIPHPRGGAAMTFESPLPEELRALLDSVLRSPEQELTPELRARALAARAEARLAGQDSVGAAEDSAAALALSPRLPAALRARAMVDAAARRSIAAQEFAAADLLFADVHDAPKKLLRACK